ncbi:nucleotide sugar dehydrogenase [Catenovulum sp. 2E275]|uniref:nucleotide sugar dehydrogenase n=1 Tax=Catenovulum sp. 2E275 TaxID=2980497 RepID=UPI0021D1C825|nr:nucleotide sugar dehydrogenase [Catenovulum sp. 2E275]MCU4674727.1 nucleotide sugar dehydrogenase [Catenovulum sp. 2E275]
MNISEKLQTSLQSCHSVIAIVGLGYVGLPLALRYSQIGYRVIGFDISEKVVWGLNTGKSHIEHISALSIEFAQKAGFQATTDFSLISECDAIILCVPTPLNKYREPDLSFVLNTMQQVAPYFRSGQALSLESTTYPGTTDEELLPYIRQQGLSVGENFFLVYSPEREDPGNPNFNTQTIPKVVGGYTAECLQVGIALYSNAIDKVVPVSSTKAAEMTKLLENIHRAVNIGLVNEMKIVADKMGIDIHEVIDAAATKPFGFTAYYPGPGIGGHCIPIDPFYLTWKAREYGVHTRFIELAGEVNSAMPLWVVDKVADALNQHKKAINGSRILILGMAYKKNVDDMRESPSLQLLDMLLHKGAYVEYSDPHVKCLPRVRKYNFELCSINLTTEILSSYDAVILATAHDAFDYKLIEKASSLIIDTRGYFKHQSAKIVKA